MSRCVFGASSADPQFFASIPDGEFVEFVPSSYSFAAQISGFDPAQHQVIISEGSVSPFSDVTFDAAGKEFDYGGAAGLVSPQAFKLQIVSLDHNLPAMKAAGSAAAGFAGSRLVAGAMQAAGASSAVASGNDWAARSSGALLADRLGTSTKFNAVATIDADNWILDDAQADHVTFDSTIKPDATSGGSLKFDVLSADGSNSGNFGVYFGNLATYGNGATVWYSYRVRAPARYWFQAHTVSSADESVRGQKVSILSDRLSSSRVNETVVQMTAMAGIVRGYHQDGTTYPGEDVAASTACSGSDFLWQPEVDNGANSLSGTNPDTGSAWSSCEQDRARYGGLYSAQSIEPFMRGLGDPLSGGFRPVPDEWVTITCRVIVGTFGSANNRFTCWAAHENQAYVLLWDSENITLGSGDPDYNCLWLLPYATNRNSGGRKWTSKTSNIGGITVHTVGTSTPTGDGELEYNATNGRFRWKSSGGSYGTARGYSSSNDITLINVTDGAQSGIVIEITNPGALPSSGTTTDTVTIATGRFDTQVNYADVIIKTSAINAPGGYAPGGA